MRRALALVAVAVLAACSRSSPADVTGVQEASGRMPTLAGQTLIGADLSAGDYAGRLVVVNFWATSCAPCRREQPVLSAAQARAGDAALFVGVNYREDADTARGYLEGFGVAYPNLRDADGELAYRFGVPFLPTTVVVDAAGQMRFRVTGAIDAATLDDLLERAAAPG
jgi:cytochrome c biogenesis protein CcmG/thiol:disulfide interchange protein DsbE